MKSVSLKLPDDLHAKLAQLSRQGERSVSYHGPTLGLIQSRQQTSMADFEALFDLIRLIDSVSWHTTDTEDVRETRATVSFK